MIVKLTWKRTEPGVYETTQVREGTDSPLYRVSRGTAPSGYYGAWKIAGWLGSEFKVLDRPATLTEAKRLAEAREVWQ